MKNSLVSENDNTEGFIKELKDLELLLIKRKCGLSPGGWVKWSSGLTVAFIDYDVNDMKTPRELKEQGQHDLYILGYLEGFKLKRGKI